MIGPDVWMIVDGSKTIFSMASVLSSLRLVATDRTEIITFLSMVLSVEHIMCLVTLYANSRSLLAHLH